MTTSTDLLFGSIMASGTITGAAFLMATFCSLIIGVFIAFMYTIKNTYSKSYIITLALLPAIVQIVIMLVNGNLGMSVAIAGAFGLIRFRSIQGSSKEIVAVFLAMTIGVATGMGFVLFASIMTIIILALWFVVIKTSIFENNEEKILKITIPENLDYTNVFDEVFAKYVSSYNLEQVKTTNMGSLFDLTYRVVLKNNIDQKKFIDEIRVRNANLKVMLSHPIESELL
mgnify:CR=1 FL=1